MLVACSENELTSVDDPEPVEFSNNLVNFANC